MRDPRRPLTRCDAPIRRTSTCRTSVAGVDVDDRRRCASEPVVERHQHDAARHARRRRRAGSRRCPWRRRGAPDCRRGGADLVGVGRVDVGGDGRRSGASDGDVDGRRRRGRTACGSPRGGSRSCCGRWRRNRRAPRRRRRRRAPTASTPSTLPRRAAAVALAYPATAGRDGVGDGVDAGQRGREVVVAEAVGELGGDHPVGPRRTGRGDPLGDLGDPALEVGGRAGLLAERGGRQHDVGERGRVGEERVEGDDDRGALDAEARRGRRPGQSPTGSASEQDEDVDLAGGGRGEDGPTASTAARDEDGARAGGRRRRCPAAVPAAPSRRVGRRRRRRRRPATTPLPTASDSARLARPATMTTGPAPSWSATSSDRTAPRSTAAAPPGSTRRLRHAYRREAGGGRAELDRGGSCAASAAWRRRRWRTGSSSLRSGPSRTTVGADAALVDGRPRADRGAPAGSPSPSWASRCRCRARRRGGPRRRRPRWCRGRRRARRCADGPFVVERGADGLGDRGRSPTFHEPSPSPRTQRRRSPAPAELTDSKPKRPLSHSQPQLTASLSTPR